MAYADRHLWSAQFDGSTTGDKAYFGGFTTRVQIHRVSVTMLDATTGAGEVVFDKLDASAGTRGSADIATLTTPAVNAAGQVLYETQAAPDVLDIGDVAIVEVTDAFDALAVVGIEYSIDEQSLADVANDAAA